MARIGYQASHEQFPPSALLRFSQLAEQAGFQSVNSSDHFHPWGEAQGHSGFSFTWLGAAMQSTALPYSMVCAPGQRYHPAIVAQAIATLGELFPGRFWVALGSGEAVNENITGERWPTKAERNTRLLECAQVIRRLLNGETVTHTGLITVHQAKLYSRPSVNPLLYCAALTPETAAWAGKWADGLLTAHQPLDKLQKVIQAFRENGGEGKPLALKAQLSYAATAEDALQGAWEQWKTNIFQGTVLSDLPTPAHFDAMARFVKPEDMHPYVNISADLNEHIKNIRSYIDLGFNDIILHNVNREQEIFINDFGAKVLPAFA
ncbi:TIGR03885 family FMN-dependent LLM class oxidoreductase [Mucilaginibacter limnophilus]|uniref:TIGR03885 family FMN-dependent LLM class oxidoreductase n=1 Tax=Mucilaginibacter limnophilus TaxID=1932778 RepID=A0A437MFM2_9SPHI|nr:TIGR03885 family FMN-dependent LLM class oxidoreductase [Mucilaginibacter limnophilus]RVT96460.1 TIGR03885 family FMN-dependent LLM class oxidoreductase [Mucilaginibacter limnophilus]